MTTPQDRSSLVSTLNRKTVAYHCAASLVQRVDDFSMSILVACVLSKCCSNVHVVVRTDGDFASKIYSATNLAIWHSPYQTAHCNPLFHSFQLLPLCL